MQKNMNKVDRLIRIVFAVVVSALNLTGVLSGVLGASLGIVAVVFLATSLAGFCPLYRVFGISSGGSHASERENGGI